MSRTSIKPLVAVGDFAGIKFRWSPLVLKEESPPIDPKWKPKWPVLVLQEIGDFRK